MNAQAEGQTGDQSQGTGGKRGSKMMMLFLWIAICAVGIGAGFATPMLLSGDQDPANARKAEPGKLSIPDPDEEIGFVEFPKQVVNINDPRFSRYLTIELSLQVAKSQVEAVKKLVEEKNQLLRDWMIAHFADKRAEDLRGTQGTNRLRREIHDAFNKILFKDGIERVQDVLFTNLNIQ